MKKTYSIVFSFILSVVSTCSMQAQDSHWSCNTYDYQYDMAVYLSLATSGNVLSNLSDYEIAAFSNDECRGVANLLTAEKDGNQTYYFYMRIRSNTISGETMTFKIYRKSLDAEADVNDSSVSFISAEAIGKPSTPLILELPDDFIWNVEVEYDEAMGNVTGQGHVERGGQISLLATPHSGYHFSQWSDGSMTNPYIFTVLEDTHLTAYFAPNQYTMTFVLDNGEENVMMTQDFGTELTAPDDPKKEGYIFTGWSPEVPATTPAEDVIYTAQYTQIIVNLDETSAMVPTESENNIKVNVKRSINANEWSTICLPFAMTTEQIKDAFGDNVILGDFNGCVTSYDATDNVVGIKVNFTNTEVIMANHPYIIKVEQPVTAFDVDGVKITPETSMSVDKDEKDGEFNSFVGTYQANTNVPQNGLFLNSGNFWYSKGKNKMKAFRGYFKFYDVLSSVEDASARIVLVLDDDMTGIAEIETKNHFDDGLLYNLDGLRVNKPKRGLYIKEGKKIFVK